MKHCKNYLVTAFLGLVFPILVNAQAPVVDESENFAIIEEQGAAQAAASDPAEAPLAKDTLDDVDYSDEPSVAKDSSHSVKKGAYTADNAGLLEKVQGLQQEIQELRGQLEVQAHDLKMLQQQQLTFYKDIDSRLREGGTAAKTGSTMPVTAATEVKKPAEKAPALTMDTKPAKTEQVVVTQTANSNRVNPAEEQISYLAAYDLVRSKQYDKAIVAMQGFISKYPQGGYAANAQYWLGELYLAKEKYPEAIKYFETVLSQYPSSSKAAASQLKIGYALAASGKTEEAKNRLNLVIKNYPDTATAHLAESKLEMLKSL